MPGFARLHRTFSRYTGRVNLDVYAAVVLGVLGALIGSFSNVLIYRLPRRESIAFPPSHCTTCGHRLGVADLVPVLSWAFLRGRCRYCGAPISARYPLVELLTAAGYVLLAVLFPWSAVGASLVGLCALWTLFLVISFIDAETRTIPDELVLPGAALGVLLGFLNARTGATDAGLPDFGVALHGLLTGAGVLSLIAILGEFVLRRGRERRFPEWPVNYQVVALGALVGAWFGVLPGVLAGAVWVGVNLAARRAVPVPELLTVPGLLVSLAVGAGGSGPGIVGMAQGALGAAGAVSLLAALYWWTQPDPPEDEEHDPVAMGFGDVKLAALMGAFLGLTGMLVSLGVAVVLGALLGVATVLLRRDNKIPFGPYLALGALVFLLWGRPLLDAFRSLYGLG